MSQRGKFKGGGRGIGVVVSELDVDAMIDKGSLVSNNPVPSKTRSPRR